MSFLILAFKGLSGSCLQAVHWVSPGLFLTYCLQQNELTIKAKETQHIGRISSWSLRLSIQSDTIVAQQRLSQDILMLLNTAQGITARIHNDFMVHAFYFMKQ